jgi:hypothetical protein
MRWAGHEASMGEDRKVNDILVGKPEGERSLGRPRRRWEDGIKINLREICGGGGGGVAFFHQGEGRDHWWAFVNTVMSLRVLAP